ncbi:hypothetical protein EPO17_01280 [Patescibacteria group bacterium]|nr:MAG: hypothetical protein EPO17_01280 [Patescibacteria group bacterium]
MKKAFGLAIFGLIFSFSAVLVISPVSAQTASETTTTTVSSEDEATLIAQLETILLQLIEQLKARGFVIDANGNLTRATPTNPEQPIDNSGAFCYNWTKDLSVGSEGPDVVALNEALSQENIADRVIEKRSYFDEATASNIVNFQAKYGIIKTGFVGPITRAKLNSLYGCSPVNDFLDVSTATKLSIVDYAGVADTLYLAVYNTSGEVVPLDTYNFPNIATGNYTVKSMYRDRNNRYEYLSAEVAVASEEIKISNPRKGTKLSNGAVVFDTADSQQTEIRASIFGKYLKVEIRELADMGRAAETFLVNLSQDNTSIVPSLGLGIGPYFNSNPGNYLLTVNSQDTEGTIREQDRFKFIVNNDHKSFTLSEIRVVEPPHPSFPMELTSSSVSSDLSGEYVDYRVIFDGTRVDPVGVTLEFACSPKVSWSPVGVTNIEVKDNITCTNFPDNNTGVDMQRISDGEYRSSIRFNNTSSQAQNVKAVAKAYGGVNGKTVVSSAKDFRVVPPGEISVPVGAQVNAELLRETGDKAGQWYTFREDGTKDWVWNMYLNLKSPKKIKAISIRHDSPNTSGEAWSTGSSQSLLGKLLYPLVVTTKDGVQLNSSYDQPYSATSPSPAYGSFEFPAGSYTLKLYGNTGKKPFDGGKIIVDFTDGTSVSSMISASDYDPLNPVTPPSTRSLRITQDPSTPIGNVVAGSTNTPLFAFKAVTGTGDVRMNGVVVSIAGVDPSKLSNLKLYAGGVLIADGVLGVYSGGFARDYQFNIPQPLNIQTNYSMNFVIKGDVSATASGTITPTLGGLLHDYGNALSVSGLGLSGNTLTITASTNTTPSLNVALDSSTPVSQTVSAGTVGVEFARIRVTAGSVAVNNLNNIQVGSDSLNAGQILTNLRVFDGTTQIGSTAGVLSYNGSYYFAWIPVSGVSIPAFTSKTFKVIADINASASGPIRAGIAGWNFSGAGANVVPFGTAIYGNTLTITTGPTTQSYIHVNSPNGGQTYTPAEPLQIEWSSSGLQSIVYVYLKRILAGGASGSLCYLGAGPSHTGRYERLVSTFLGYQCPNIPDTLTAGQYKVSLMLSNGTPAQAIDDMIAGNGNTVADESDSVFTISSSTPMSVAPTISSITAQFSQNGTVTIAGSNFSPTENYVQIDNTPVGPLQFGPLASTQNGTVITFVPASMTTQILSGGVHSVQVIRNPGYYISNTVTATVLVSAVPTTPPTISFNINGQSATTVSQLNAGTNMSLTWNSTNADYCEARSGGSFDTLWTGEKARTSGAQTITIPAEMNGTKTIAIQCRNAAGWQVVTALFAVVAPASTSGSGGILLSTPPADIIVSPAPQPSTVAQPTLSASLSPVYADRAGRIGVFGPGPGNPNASSHGNVNDFVWNTSLTLGAEKTIKSIDMNHNVGGEYWSTVNVNAYPLVIFYNGSQVNTAYGQTLGTYGAGTTNLVIYAQHENPYFSGGTLRVTFTDNTTVSATVPSSSFSPQVPAQSAAAIDAMSDILKRMLQR